MTKVRVAILDDYQQVAFKCADWSSIQGRLSVDVYTETLLEENALIERLERYEIICAMRERTKFPPSLLDRLPKLKMIATTGMMNRAIDVKHAANKGIIVSGTSGRGDSTLEHIWALILSTTRHIAAEDRNVKQGNPQWQTMLPLGLSGRTLGLVGVGRLGSRTALVSTVIAVPSHTSDPICLDC